MQKNTLNPEFDEEFLFWFWGKGSPIKEKVLKLDVFDKNVVGLDTHLGKVTIPLQESAKNGNRMRLGLHLRGVVKKEPVVAGLVVELKLMVGGDKISMV